MRVVPQYDIPPPPPRNENGEELEVCRICLVEMDANVTSQICGHRFHGDCITHWFQTNRDDCPLCRATILFDVVGNEENIPPPHPNRVPPPPPQGDDAIVPQIVENDNEEENVSLTTDEELSPVRRTNYGSPYTPVFGSPMLPRYGSISRPRSPPSSPSFEIPPPPQARRRILFPSNNSSPIGTPVNTPPPPPPTHTPPPTRPSLRESLDRVVTAAQGVARVGASTSSNEEAIMGLTTWFTALHDSSVITGSSMDTLFLGALTYGPDALVNAYNAGLAAGATAASPPIQPTPAASAFTPSMPTPHSPLAQSNRGKQPMVTTTPITSTSGQASTSGYANQPQPDTPSNTASSTVEKMAALITCLVDEKVNEIMSKK